MNAAVRQLQVGGFDHNFSYLVVAENGDAALVDPTGDAAVIRRALAEFPAAKPRYILLTHGHLDHTQALGEAVTFFPAPVIAHPNHPERGKKSIFNGSELPFGEGKITTIFTPGHSRDSVCYRLNDQALFSGDVLFVGCIGFCRSKEMYKSLTERILPLPDSIMVYSGHDYGEVPFRTLGEEKQHNVYLQCSSYEEFRERLKGLK